MAAIGELFVAIKADVAGAIRDLRSVREEGTKAGNQAESSFLRGAEAAKRYAAIVTGAVATGAALAKGLDEIINRQDTLNKLASDFARTLSGITNSFSQTVQQAQAAFQTPLEQGLQSARAQRNAQIQAINAATDQAFEDRAGGFFGARNQQRALNIARRLTSFNPLTRGLNASLDQIADPLLVARTEVERASVGARQQAGALGARLEDVAIETARRQSDPRFAAEEMLRIQREQLEELKRLGVSLTNGATIGVQP